MFPLRCVSSSVLRHKLNLFSRLIDLARLNRVKQPSNTRSGGEKNYTYNVTHARMSCNQYSGLDSMVLPSIRHTHTEKRGRKKKATSATVVPYTIYVCRIMRISIQRLLWNAVPFFLRRRQDMTLVKRENRSGKEMTQTRRMSAGLLMI